MPLRTCCGLVSKIFAQATDSAFVAIRADRTVVAWGDASAGGDCSRVQDQLVKVAAVQATDAAFAAILEDGGVVAWGLQSSGGNCDLDCWKS